MSWNDAKRLRPPKLAGKTSDNVIAYIEDNSRFCEDLMRSLSDAFTEITSIKFNTELTIATGAITINPNFFQRVVLHFVDTESDAATDDLDTISGGYAGLILILYAADSARTVVCKDGTGNLLLAGDFSLDDAADSITLIYDGSNWKELSRSNNA